MESYQVVLATLGVVVVLKVLVLLAAGKGSLARLGPATSAFFSVMGSAEKAAKVGRVLNPPPPEPAKAPKLSGEPLRLLKLLQNDEGRLLDFVLEDIAGATDEQVGAGVRRLHQAWQKVVKEHLTLEPIMAGAGGRDGDGTGRLRPVGDPRDGQRDGQPAVQGAWCGIAAGASRRTSCPRRRRGSTSWSSRRRRWSCRDGDPVPLAPVLRGEGLGVRGSYSACLSPSPPRSARKSG